METICVDATIDNLENVLDFVNAFLKKNECPFKIWTQIAIAVEEIFVNIAHYAYFPEVGKVEIYLDFNGSFSITFKDRGIPHNPLERSDPDITISAEARSIGGLGIFIVKQMMDKLEYVYEDGKNILTMQKNMTSQ